MQRNMRELPFVRQYYDVFNAPDFSRQYFLPPPTLGAELEVLERYLREHSSKQSNGFKFKLGLEAEGFCVDRRGMPLMAGSQAAEELGGLFTTESRMDMFEVGCTPRAVEPGNLYATYLESLGSRAATQEWLNRHHPAALVCSSGVALSGQPEHLSEKFVTPKGRYLDLSKNLRRYYGEERYDGRDLFGHSMAGVTPSCGIGNCCAFQPQFQEAIDDAIEGMQIMTLARAATLVLTANAPLLFGSPTTHYDVRNNVWTTAIGEPNVAEDVPPSLTQFGPGHWLDESVEGLVDYFYDLLTLPCPVDPVIGEIPDIEGLATVLHMNKGRWHTGRLKLAKVGDSSFPGAVVNEIRSVGAGPSVVDEIAVALFCLAFRVGFKALYGSATNVMDYGSAQRNYEVVCKDGPEAELVWLNGQRRSGLACAEDCLRIAEQGLEMLDYSRDEKRFFWEHLRCRINKEGGRLQVRNPSWYIMELYNRLSEMDPVKRGALIARIVAFNGSQGPLSQWPEPSTAILWATQH